MASAFLNVNDDVRFDNRLEAAVGNLDTLGSRRDIRYYVEPFVVRPSWILHAGRVVDDQDIGPDNDSAGRIENDAAHRTVRRLPDCSAYE